MRLFIANCTKQSRKINYRLDFGRDGMLIMDSRMRAVRSLPIGAGRTIEIPGLVHESQCTSIMQQLERYGARQVTEKNRLPRAVVPYLMSVEQPIPMKMIAEVLAHNNGVLTVEGRARREAAAIAATDTVTRAVNEQQASAEIRNTSVEFQQQLEEGETGPPTGPTNEGFHVTDSAPVPEGGKGNKGRGRGRRADA